MRFMKNETVRTASSLLEGRAFVAAKVHQEARRSDCPGLVVDHLGATYLVSHEDEIVAAVYEEQELKAEPSIWTVRYHKEGAYLFSEFASHDEAKTFTLTLTGETTIEGPLYTDREPEEGKSETKDLFAHLDDDIV